MRVGSNTLFDNNVANLSLQQNRLFTSQQQISSGRRLLTASVDPVAAARAQEISQSDAQNTQFSANRTAARHTLSLAEGALQSVTTLIQDVQSAVISAGNGGFTNAERLTVANDLDGRLQQLIGLANSTDGAGNYLFSGFQVKNQPFNNVGGAVTYAGDDGQRALQVNAPRQMPVSASGNDVFMRIKNGNGSFVTSMSAAINPVTGTVGNTGTGVISAGSVVNPAAVIPGTTYQIDFAANAAGGMDYTVTANPPVATALPTAVPYVSGQAISFDGIQFDIKGTPKAGDAFTVAPSTNESIFTTMSNMIAALKTPLMAGAPEMQAKLQNTLTSGTSSLNNALDVVLTTRASLGLRLNELDALQIAGDDLGTQYKQTLSVLQDVDYNKAISDLNQQQMYLTAAQKSFAQVAQLSMFSYM